MNGRLHVWMFCILLVVLTACNPNSPATPIGSVAIRPATEKCIESFDMFAYSIPDAYALEQKAVLPSDPWQIEALLPDLQNGDFAVEATRQIDGHIEVWLKLVNAAEVYRELDANKSLLLVYRTDTNGWRIIPAQTGKSGIFVDNIFVTSDGSIFGRNVWAYNTDISNIPVLSRYNDKENRFEFEQNTQAIPHGWIDSDPNTVDYPVWDKILLDSNGLFWLFAYKNAIYSYDPSSQEIMQRAEINNFEIIHQVILAPDGSIFFTVLSNTMNEVFLKDGSIFQFIPKTGVINSIKIPHEPWPVFQNMLIDNSGRLWLDAIGWRDTNGEWYELQPNIPSYLQEYMKHDAWSWNVPPTVFLETSDGRIWFRINWSNERQNLKTGMAWFNPETNEGCWFTSAGTNIVEDQLRNLWMVADGKLYKYPLDQ